ncbi:MAG: hypothetical protein SO232_05325 [Candidatus Onthovivens sp.]|nr:hypothetical protein [Candidatus Onthovivens sp.]
MKKRLIHILLFLVLIISSIGVSFASFTQLVNEKDFTSSGVKDDSSSVVCINLTNNKMYTTIHSALNDAISGDVITLKPGNLKNYNTLDENPTIPDKVTYHLLEKAEIKSGVTLIIPTDTDSLDGITNSTNISSYIQRMEEDSRDKGTTSSYGLQAKNNENLYLRTSLIIDENVTLINSGNLIVSGYLSGGTSGAGIIGHVSHSYSQILMSKNSKIIQSNTNSNIYCYGYINEIEENNGSTLDLNSGNLYIPFVVKDYRGFTFSWSMTVDAINDYMASPFNQIELQNINTQLFIRYNCKVYGKINVYVTYSSSFVNVDKNFPKTINLIGNNSNFIICFNNEYYSYLYFKYDKINDQMNINFYGGFDFNYLDLQLSYSSVTVDLSTRHAYFPISYKFKISLLTSKGQMSSIYNLTNQKFKFLTGSSIYVGPNSQINASNIIVYSSFYDGSLGNGASSNNAYNGVKYPLKEGAVFEIDSNALLNISNTGGVIYSNNQNNIVVTGSSSLVVNEAWSTGSSTGLLPPWTINEYLQIKETLEIHPIEDLSKNKLYVGMNIFRNYNSFIPSVNILVDEVQTINVKDYQKVLFFEEINTYQFEFVSNIYKCYYNSIYYEKGKIVNYNDTNKLICIVNSTLSISNDNNSINEFDVQSIEIECLTPEVNGKVPLYVGTSITLKEHIVDYDKIYNKKITRESEDDSIATVTQSGIVTGISLGSTKIYCKCDGVVGVYLANVIEEEDITNVESIYIVDNKGNNSNEIKGSDSHNGSDSGNFEYNGIYKSDMEVTYTVNILPENAAINTITWTLQAYDPENQYIKDGTPTNEKNFIVVYNGDTGANPDRVTIKCVVQDLSGNTFTATFVACHDNFRVCITEGTLISMADGTLKAVEHLNVGDQVKVFNHMTGKVDTSFIAVNVHENQERVKTNVINLVFSNGLKTRISFEHGFFDKVLNEYVYINETNYKEMIGRQFVYIANDKVETITLNNAYITYEEIYVFSPVTYKNLNIISDGLLSIGGDLRGLFNYFELDENMKVIEEKMLADIETYGLFTYEEWAEYLTPIEFEAFNVKYLKVSIGKGLVTMEEIMRYINSYLR